MFTFKGISIGYIEIDCLGLNSASHKPWTNYLATLEFLSSLVSASTISVNYIIYSWVFVDNCPQVSYVSIF